MKKIAITSFCCIGFLLGIITTTPSYSHVRSEYWHQRVSLFECLPVDNSNIVFLGNSITDGGEFAELFDNPKIINRGISGDVISGVRERVGQVLKGSPRKIFLLIGINDISHNKAVSELAREYEMLVKEIAEKSPSTRLYIQSVMPVNNDFNRYKNLIGKEDTVRQLNLELERISAKYDATYVDLFSALSDSDSGKLKKEFTNDGLHLSGKGYLVWRDCVKKYVDE